MTLQKQREAFDKLRAAYLAKRDRWATLRAEAEHKYGSCWKAPIGVQKKIAAASEQEQKASDRFFDLLRKISPRNWYSGGAPAQWILRDLAFEDAIRPSTEPLSVVPPLSHGAHKPMT